MSYPDFSRAFQAGQELLSPHSGEIILTPHNLGELILTSGQLVACDPFVGLNTKPFTANLAPGRYPVILSVAHMQKSGNRRVAYAMLRLSNQPAVRWEMATCPGEDLADLKEGEIFGYGVDTGTGCFIDANAAEIIDTLIDTIFTDKLEEALEKNYSPTWDWAVLPVDNYSEANIIAFKSGWGDGVYASYFGYDTENNIVNVVTDFDP